MTFLKGSVGAALFAVMASSPALALTAEDLWSKWQKDTSDLGIALTATSLVRDGDFYRIESPEISTEFSGRVFTFSMPYLVLRDVGSGEVDVVIPAAQPGMIVSGERSAEILISSEDAVLRYASQGDHVNRMFSAASIHIEAAALLPGRSDSIHTRLEVSLSGLVSNPRSSGGAPGDLILVSSGGIDVSMKSNGSDVHLGSEFGETVIMADMADGTRRIESDARDLSVSLSRTGFPGIAFSIDRISTESLIEGLLDFSSRFSLESLNFSDELWNMFDNRRLLARGSLDASAVLHFEANSPGSDTIPEFDGGKIMIENAALSGLGLQVSASGEVRLPGSASSMADGPAGAEAVVDLEISGAETLLSDLQAAGLLGTREIAIARFMLGSLARSVGEDTHAIKAEIRPDGSILANGQRIR